MFVVVWLNNLVNSFSGLSQGLHRESSMDSLTTASALRAIEPVHSVQTVTPTFNLISVRDSYSLDHRAHNFAALSHSTTSVQVSDLLREQFYLQSEISYGSHASSTRHTSRSPSPAPGEGQDREERLGTYRATISITPATPPRPNTEEKQQESDGSADKTSAVGGPAGAGEQENLQQLIKQVKIYFLKMRYVRSE